MTPLEDRMLQVGNICQKWSAIEYQFAYTIWHLLGLDEATGKIVTGGLDMLPRAGMAIALARHLKAPRALELALTAARKRIQDGLNDRRNTAVHGVHFGDPNVVAVTFVEVHRGKGDRIRKEVPSDEYRELGRALFVVWEALFDALEAQGIQEPAKKPPSSP